MSCLAADQAGDLLGHFLELFLQFSQFVLLGFAKLIDHELQTKLSLPLGLLGLRLLVLAGLLGSPLLILRRLLLLAGLGGTAHGIGGGLVGALHLLGLPLHVLHGLLCLLRQPLLLIGNVVEALAILGLHLVGVLPDVVSSRVASLAADLLLLLKELAKPRQRFLHRPDSVHAVHRPL
jgi:hypothetical protein